MATNATSFQSPNELYFEIETDSEQYLSAKREKIVQKTISDWYDNVIKNRSIIVVKTRWFSF